MQKLDTIIQEEYERIKDHNLEKSLTVEEKLETIIHEEYNKIKDLITEDKVASPLGRSLHVNSPFGPRWGKMHNGVDYDAKVGTPVKSVDAGTVSTARFSNNACGGTIVIKHNNGFQSTYCHMSNIKVAKGQEVQQGTEIGLSGGKKGSHGAGNSLGPHLHFGLQLNGSFVDPEKHVSTSISSTPDPIAIKTIFDPSGSPGVGDRQFIDYLQTAMDWLGFIPGYGDVIDVINAIIYFARGKYVDGLLSMIAIVPFVGSFVSKGLRAGIKTVGKTGFNKAIYAASKGNRKQLDEYWAALIRTGKIDKATLKKLDQAGDHVAGMLRSSKRTLKKYVGGSLPNSVYKQMDEVAEIMAKVVPDVKKVSIGTKIVKGTGKAVVGTGKAAVNVTKGIVKLPVRILLSPITLPIAMAKATIRTLTGANLKASRGLLKRVVGKNASQIDEMEMAVRSSFKQKLGANPLLLSNIIKTNGVDVLSGAYFKGHKISSLSSLKNLHTKSIKEIESTLTSLFKSGQLSKLDYKNLIGNVSDAAAHKGNPYYNTFIGDAVKQWATGHNPALRFKGAWDYKPWYDWPKRGVKSYDVISNEIQDFAEKFGLEDKDDPQGVILEALVMALRGSGILSDEKIESMKDFSKTHIKPIYSGLKQSIIHYATYDNIKDGAIAFKKYTYGLVPGLDDKGKEVSSGMATAGQKWNYLSTHSSEFASGTWEVIKLLWNFVMEPMTDPDTDTGEPGGGSSSAYDVDIV